MLHRYCNKSNIVAKQYVSTLQKTPVCKPAYDVIENASQTTPGCRVPAEIPRPPYIVNDRNDGTLGHRLIRSFFSGEAKSLVKNAEMIDRIHQACRVGRRVLNHVGLAVQVCTSFCGILINQTHGRPWLYWLEFLFWFEESKLGQNIFNDSTKKFLLLT